MRGATLGIMAQYAGMVVMAGILAAVYQLVHEETRGSLQLMRQRWRYRSVRHEGLLMELLGSPLPFGLQDHLLASRDAFRTCLEMLADPAIDIEDKDLIRQILRQVHGSRPE